MRTNKQVVGNNIAKAILNNNMKQKELAEALNATEATVSHWVSGIALPNSYLLYRTAKILNTSMEALMQGVDID